MEAITIIFSLKGKANIKPENVKSVRDIRTKDLSWYEFKRHFRKKYLLERYYDKKAKEFYELKMGLMKEEEYMTKFLVLLRYVPYIKDEKENFHIFVSGFPLAFRERIEYDEPWSIDEFIGKFKHFYE